MSNPEFDPYTVSIEGYNPDNPFAVAGELNQRISQEAGNNELRDIVVVAHAAHLAVWNRAAEAVKQYGAPIRTDEYIRVRPKPFVQVEPFTTGLVELRGMTGEVSPVIPAIRITSPYSVMPYKLEDVPEHTYNVSGEVMRFGVFMARPAIGECAPTEIKVTETRLPQSLRWWTRGALESMSKLKKPAMEAFASYADYPGQVDTLEVSNAFTGNIDRPEMPRMRGDLTDHIQVEAVARKHLARYNHMNVLYNYIGAMAAPLRDDPRFSR